MSDDAPAEKSPAELARELPDAQSILDMAGSNVPQPPGAMKTGALIVGGGDATPLERDTPLKPDAPYKPESEEVEDREV